MDFTPLEHALSGDAKTRQRAEEALHAATRQPGFCAYLLAATQLDSRLSDAARLVAATQLKNVVVRQWRRGAGGIAAAERPALRAGLVGRLTQPETSELVGVQIALAVAKVMRSEANAGEAAVLEAFAAALQRAEMPGHALLALLHTAKELCTMRLPTQRRLAARVGRVMLGSLAPLWRAALQRSVGGGGGVGVEALRSATLHTKVLRRLVALAALDAAPPPPAAAAAGVGGGGAASAAAGGWEPQAAIRLAFDAGSACQRAVAAHCALLDASTAADAGLAGVGLGPGGGGLGGGGGGSGGESRAVLGAWSKLSGALGKLLLALRNGGGLPPGSSVAIAREALACLMCEASERSTMRDACGLGSGGGEQGALLRLEAREEMCSPYPLQLCAIVEGSLSEDDGCLAALAAAAADGATDAHLAVGGGGSVPSSAVANRDPLGLLVHGLVALMAQTVSSLRAWASDAEGFACEELLPSLTELDDDDEEDEADEEEEAEAGLGADGADDGGNGGDDAEADRAGTASGRLRQAADGLLASVLSLAPEEVGASLLALLPSTPISAAESLSQQVHREACYTALGVGAWQLQASLTYSQLLAASVSEAEAVATSPALAMAAPLQARLCWLLSCWWGFGGTDDDAENVRASDASYALLCRLLSHGADLAVRLQAAHTLRTLLHSVGADELLVFSPHAPSAFAGLAAALVACSCDDACVALLKSIRQLLRQLPSHVAHEAVFAKALQPSLVATWQRSAAEQRMLLLRELRRVAAAVKGVCR